MFGRIAVGVTLAALVVYGFIEARPLILGPSLTVTSPEEGETIHGLVQVGGRVARSSALTLNGSPILADEKGSFATTLTYAAGASILTFTARDRFGRTLTLTRTIYVVPSATSTNQ